ncbi:MAG: extracellular solute-binding protein [Spirochaetaceae bacterium]|jgi:multiple sugar transport system substrate-binding protein|nr:extracellular solute-binding protein [Spirochaetaceae bacterium]
MKQRHIVTIISVILSIIAVFILIIRLNEPETPLLAQERWLELNEEAQLIFTQYWRLELEEGVFDWLISEFEKRYPSISIRINDLSYSEMQNSVINETIFSESDLLAVNPRWLYEAITHEQLEMISKPQEQEAWTVPVISFMDLLFYRSDLLQAAGFDKPPKTRDEFLRYARGVNQEGFGIGLALSPENPLGLYTDVFSWIWASGGQLVQNGRLNINSREALEVFEFFNTLDTEDLLLPEMFSQTNEQKIDAFVNGSIAMMIASISTIAVLRSRMTADKSFGVTSIPIADSYVGKPIFGLTNWDIAVSRYSPHKEAARLFIDFLLEQAPVLAVSAHAVPVALVNPQKHHEDVLYRKAFDIYTSGNAIQEFDLFPRNHELEPLIRDELYTMFEEGHSPEQTVLAIQSKWDGH